MVKRIDLSLSVDRPRMRRLQQNPSILSVVTACVAAVMSSASPDRQVLASAEGTPTATLIAAPTLKLTGDVDSNSPALWDLVDGRPLLHVLTSTAGRPSVTSGRLLARLGEPAPVGFTSHPGHGVWMEAVVADEAGTWYGYYHNEWPAVACNRLDRAVPRVGAARSRDRGRTWEDLGTILEAPPDLLSCSTRNAYFVGGVGDFSVMLDATATNLYLFFSQYSRPPEAQGVAIARLLWADRDEPQGRANVWSAGVWLPATAAVDTDDQASPVSWTYPAGTSVVRSRRPWHDTDAANDAYWGPSVHRNTYLGQYVMLLNRAKDDQWGQEGVYVSFAASLSDPETWSSPQRVLSGGTWYPQVIGTEPAYGTDKIAGERARFFMSGTSDYFIEFQRPGDR
jgi:hypothetical protein